MSTENNAPRTAGLDDPVVGTISEGISRLAAEIAASPALA
jgi:hypothetical protein